MKSRNIFKKGALLFSIFFIVALFSAISVSAADGVLDQTCNVTAGNALGVPENNLAQTFKPTYDWLDGIKFEYYGGNDDGGVGLKLYHNDELVKRAELVDEVQGRNEATVSFEVPVIPGDTYKIRPYVSAGSVFGWYFQPSDCYPDGKGFQDETTRAWDFSFATYGHNVAASSDDVGEPIGDPPPEPEDSSESGDSDSDEEEESGDSDDMDDDEEDEEDEDEESSETDSVTTENESISAENSNNSDDSNNIHNLISTENTSTTSDDQGQSGNSNDNQLVVDVANQADNMPTSKGLSLAQSVLLISIFFAILILTGYYVYKYINRNKQIEQENENKKIPAALALGIIIIIAMVIGIYFVTAEGGIFQFLKKEVKPAMNQAPLPTIEQMTAPVTDELERVDDFDDWLTYNNERYDYQFRYPPGAEVNIAPQSAFSMSSEERAAGMTFEDLYREYGGEICMTIYHGPGYINISAPANHERNYVLCGRTGVGCNNLTAEMTSEDIITNQTEEIEIEGLLYGAQGSEVNCPEGDMPELDPRSEFFRISMDDNTKIEYGSRPSSSGYTFDEYLEMKDELLDILSSLDFEREISE